METDFSKKLKKKKTDKSDFSTDKKKKDLSDFAGKNKIKTNTSKMKNTFFSDAGVKPRASSGKTTFFADTNIAKISSKAKDKSDFAGSNKTKPKTKTNKPRIVSKKINKKERRLAILSALYLKKQHFVFVNEETYMKFDSVKTKKVCELISTLDLKQNAKILFVLEKQNKFFWLSTRNLKNVEVTTATCLNIEQLLNASHIILSNNGLDLINSTYGKNYE